MRSLEITKDEIIKLISQSDIRSASIRLPEFPIEVKEWSLTTTIGLSFEIEITSSVTEFLEKNKEVFLSQKTA